MSLVWPSVSDVERIDAAELPAALVHLSALAATIASRMVPQPRAVSLAPAPPPDTLLDADAVAARLRVPKAYVRTVPALSFFRIIPPGVFQKHSATPAVTFLLTSATSRRQVLSASSLEFAGRRRGDEARRAS
jgi:hypothetical protein